MAGNWVVYDLAVNAHRAYHGGLKLTPHFRSHKAGLKHLKGIELGIIEPEYEPCTVGDKTSAPSPTSAD